MKFSFVFQFLLFSFLYGNGQESYTAPCFKGGYHKFTDYLAKYSSYPYHAAEIQSADVNAVIYVSKEGKVKFVNLVGGPTELRNETKRLLTIMPDWHPGKLNGNAVDTFITQKIIFSYNESRRKKSDSSIVELLMMPYQIEITESEVKKQQIEREKTQKITSQFFEQGMVEFQKSNFKDAIDYFKKSEANGNRKPELYYNIGVAYVKLEEISNACSYFSEAARRGDEEAYKLCLKMCR